MYSVDLSRQLTHESSIHECIDKFAITIYVTS